jgi:hypothetical protein
MRLQHAAKRLERFYQGSLTSRLAALESAFCTNGKTSYTAQCVVEEIDTTLLSALLAIKRVAGQINVSIHAVGILLALPQILKRGERVETLSLGAGNTGRAFDLVTNRRVAEFKFFHWQGGSETIRQNALFKDFYYLAESRIRKPKFLYVLGCDVPLRFLNGGRALRSVMSKNAKLMSDFREQHGERFKAVREYFAYRKEAVQIVDLLGRIPSLRAILSED